jgi:hypothetical protein
LRDGGCVVYVYALGFGLYCVFEFRRESGCVFRSEMDGLGESGFGYSNGPYSTCGVPISGGEGFGLVLVGIGMYEDEVSDWVGDVDVGGGGRDPNLKFAKGAMGD